MTAALSLDEIAVRLAQAASEVLLTRFRADDLVIDTKTLGLDIVTDADRAAEAAIAQLLHELRPGDGMVGEEGTGITTRSGVTWVIDPLDSTANYARGLPLWSVSVAAQTPEGSAAAAVAGPALGELFTSLDPVRAPMVVDASSALVLLGWGPSAAHTALGGWVGRHVTRGGKVRIPGSPALGLAWASAGRASAAYYAQDLHTWDVSAGLHLCRRQGLRTHVETSSDARHPHVLAAVPHLFDQLMDEFALGSRC